MEHENSILYRPVNEYIWRHAFGVDIPDHVIMALLVLLISAIVFPLASRRFSKDNPGKFQHMLELVVEGLRSLLDDIIGHDGRQYLYIIGAFATFIFISNIFGLFFFLQPPTANPNVTFGLAARYRWGSADSDRSGWLSPREFATTRPKAKARPKKCAC